MSLGLDHLVEVASAAAEPTRLRILGFLASTELTVGQLTELLAQSQPRVSRHLKVLLDSGLIHRTPEGSFAWFRLARDGAGAALVEGLLAQLDQNDPVVRSDKRKLGELRAARAASSQSFFDRHASEWEQIRALHVADDRVEAAIRGAIAQRKPGSLLDLGTGTGRMLELFGDQIITGLGIDVSPNMLAIARANLERASMSHCSVRHGNLLSLEAESGRFEATLLHQVLHLLDEPERAIAEAARTLAPGGWLLVVDFAPHPHEFLRTEHAHRRLGFPESTVIDWMTAAGLIAHCTTLPADRPDGIAISLWIGERPSRSRVLRLPGAKPVGPQSSNAEQSSNATHSNLGESA
jgi:ubiquinone/menaquinone biosynthesis C-methylase UbiE